MYKDNKKTDVVLTLRGKNIKWKKKYEKNLSIYQ